MKNIVLFLLVLSLVFTGISLVSANDDPGVHLVVSAKLYDAVNMDKTILSFHGVVSLAGFHNEYPYKCLVQVHHGNFIVHSDYVREKTTGKIRIFTCTTDFSVSVRNLEPYVEYTYFAILFDALGYPVAYSSETHSNGILPTVKTLPLLLDVTDIKIVNHLNGKVKPQAEIENMYKRDSIRYYFQISPIKDPCKFIRVGFGHNYLPKGGWNDIHLISSDEGYEHNLLGNKDYYIRMRYYDELTDTWYYSKWFLADYCRDD